jgi:ribosomal protein L11 methyltransferase
LLPCKKIETCRTVIGYHFNIEPRELGSEILIALGETAFESFTETETGISAFVQKRTYGMK